MTLIAVLRDATGEQPDAPLIVTPQATLSYRECLERAEAFAHGLAARSIDRFACVVADVAQLLPLLCASTATGSEACVYPPAGDDALIDDYTRAFHHNVVVSDRPIESDVATVLPVGDLPASDARIPVPGERSPTLILTTGTTGRPRGVRHDWARLVAATRRSDDQRGARWLLAYNLNQFAGTQILLHVLVNRATLVAPASNQPRDALAAARDLGVTHISATPTFWRLFTALLDEGTARALHLRQITLGGEAVPAPVLESLSRFFPDTKISQVYAGNEFGSVGSVRDHRSGLPAALLDKSEDADIRLRIVDGELQINSRFGMLGYFGEPDVAGGWLPTGDIVRVEGDRIVFMGRVSETINVGGVKVHPLPVEEAAGTVDGVALVHAYGRPSAVTGQIVALDVVLQDGADATVVEESIRAACRSLLPAAQPRRIRFVDQIATSGNKVSRQADR